MPMIRIDSDEKIANIIAVHAVHQWMVQNNDSGYHEQREIFVGGERILVKEERQDKDTSICSCNFTVSISS